MEQFKYGEITSIIIRCAMNVHCELKNGFQEVIYQRALEKEFQQCDIAYAREYEIPVIYKGDQIGTRRVDFLVNGIISTEIKAVSELEDRHVAQAINYLEAMNLEIGLLINFGEKSLVFRRLTNHKFHETK